MFYPAIPGFERADRSDTRRKTAGVPGRFSFATKLLLADQRLSSLISFVDLSKRSITSSGAWGCTPRVQSCRFRTHTAESTSPCKFWSVLFHPPSPPLSPPLFLSLLSSTQLFPTSQSLTKWKQYWLVNLTRELRIGTILQFSDESDSSCIPL